MVELEWLADEPEREVRAQEGRLEDDHATVTVPKSVYIERRPTATHSGRPARAPYSELAMPTSALASARTRQARPSVSTSGGFGVGAELRRALGDQRVALGHESPAFALDGHDHLAPRAEGVGHDSLVANRDRYATGALAHAEVEDVAPRLYPGMTLPVSW